MGFLGMRGTDDWATNERPTSYRQGVLRIYPNGAAPLTAIMSKLASERVDDPEYHWWTKEMSDQQGTVTGRYVNTDLSTTYSTAQAINTLVYLKMSAADSAKFKPRHQVLMRHTDDYSLDCTGKVISVETNGASSYLCVKLLEADDNSTASGTLANCDLVQVIGTVNAEGSAMPTSLTFNPTQVTNKTQIFIDSLDATRTAMQTRYRTDKDKLSELKRETLEYHSIGLEKAFLFGVQSDSVGDNNKPERTTDGLITAIRNGAPANVHHFPTDTGDDYVNQKWVDVGEDWLDEKLEIIFRRGTGSYADKMVFAGSQAVAAINKMIKKGAQYQLKPMTAAYGIKVVEWHTAFGAINLITHPLFSYNVLDRRSMVIFTPRRLRFRYVQDTIYVDDRARKESTFFSKNGGEAWSDGIKECYLTEAGLEWDFVVDAGILTGVGENQISAPAAV